MSATGHIVLRSRHEAVALRLPIRALAAVLILVILLAGVIATSLALGSYEIDLPTLISALVGNPASGPIDNVIWQFRFPRALAAALVGAMMAVSGAAIQNVTRNGLADPSLVGIAQGAALAVVLGIVAVPGLDEFWRPPLAFAGALSVAVLVQSLSHLRRGDNAIRFILLGVGMSGFLSSMTSALLTYGDIDRAMSALSWLSGSIDAATWKDVTILTTWSALLLPILLGLSRSMSVLRMGEEAAIGLGISVGRIRYGLIAVAVGFAAAATAVVGPIGFVGLIAPHAARRIAHAGSALHIIITALCGASLVAMADLIGRITFMPIQIPAGLVTSVIGVPIFIWLLQRAAARPQS